MNNKGRDDHNDKITKVLIILIISIIMVPILLSCGGIDKVPDGRYEAVDYTSAFRVMTAIVIKGDDIVMLAPLTAMGMPVKYTYKDGIITFTDGVTGVDMSCEYKNGSIWYSGEEYRIKEEEPVDEVCTN